MAHYSMYPQTTPPQVMYQIQDERDRQRKLEAQMHYYSEQQHVTQQPHSLGMTDMASSYGRGFPTTYNHMPMAYSMAQPGYTTGMAITEDLHHGYPYPQILGTGLLQGMADEVDTASRPRLTAEQTRELEILYAANNKPSTQQKTEYAARFRLTKNRVDNWFQNRRAKTKHQNKPKQTEVTLGSVKGNDSQPSTPSYPSSTALPSQNSTMDSINTATYGNGTGLASQDGFVPMKHSPSQDSAHSEYDHAIDYTASGQVLPSDPRQVLSPTSVESFDYHNAANYTPTTQFPNEYSSSHMNGMQSPTDMMQSHNLFMERRPGFADRRAQRPAALSTMRSTSSSSLKSPLLTAGSVQKSLRRINTCASPLNKTYRIQKYTSITPPLRSPGALSQALNQAMSTMSPPMLSDPVSPEHADIIDEMNDQDHASPAVIFNVNPPSAEVSWSENINGDFPVPPLSATLSGDDTSPPITPLPGQNNFNNQWIAQDMSSSATTAANTFTHPSPMMMPEQCLTPQAQHSVQPFWDSSQMNDLFSMPESYDFNASVAQAESLASQYGYTPMMRRNNEPLKIEFSHPYARAEPHYYVPLRENQNYIFHEYDPNGRRPE